MDAKEKLMFGERLRRCRAEKQLTQEETAERLNISLRYYQMLERGEKVGSVDMLTAACRLLGCSLDYLLLGRVSEQTDDPIAARLNSLPQRKRKYAEQMLLLFIESMGE